MDATSRNYRRFGRSADDLDEANPDRGVGLLAGRLSTATEIGQPVLAHWMQLAHEAGGRSVPPPSHSDGDKPGEDKEEDRGQSEVVEHGPTPGEQFEVLRKQVVRHIGQTAFANYSAVREKFSVE